MGRPALRGALPRFGWLAAAVSWTSASPAQVPVPGPRPPVEDSRPLAPSPPAAPAPPAALPAPPPAPDAAPGPAAPAATRAPPPLDPPPSLPPATGPSFLRSREDVETARRDRADREGRARRPDDESRTDKSKQVARDFVLGATPWVDFSLTNFWLDNRSSNFLNLGVQVGGYFVERLRVTARLVAPLEEAKDDQYSNFYGSDSSVYLAARSRSIAVLYGGSLGLILSNSRTFLFAPGLLIMRTDVEDYGTSGFLALPFEWTTSRHLRIGFEMALGHAFGGSQSDDSGGSEDRPGGTAVLLQFYMGWSMGRL